MSKDRLTINRTLYKKILIFLIVLILLAFGVVLIRRIFLNKEINALGKDFLATKQKTFQTSHNLTRDLIDAIRTDYTIWDEMVEAVEDRNQEWFDENVPGALQTYKVDKVWIYNADYQLVYIASTDDGNPSDFPISSLRENSEELFKNGYFTDFNAKIGDGVYEVMSAPIQPSGDSQRISTPKGYFFVARELGSSYLKKLSDINDADVKVSTSTDEISPDLDITKGMIEFGQPINDWKNQSIGSYLVKAYSPVLERDTLIMNQQVAVFGISMVSAMTIVFLIIAVLILRPLRRLSVSMATGDINTLSKLVDRGDELGQAARLIKQSWEQQSVLAISNRRLEDTQRQLENQNKESQRINDLMIGRELKMIELKKQIKDLKSKKTSARHSSRDKQP